MKPWLPLALAHRHPRRRPLGRLRPRDSAPVPPPAPATFDLATVMRTVHFAYRPDGARHRAEHSTYEVSVGEGRIGIAPRGRRGCARAATAGAPGRLAIALGPAPRRAWPPTAISARDRAGSPRREAPRRTRRGVEQSGDFATRPEGRGDLEVRVTADGLGFAGATAGGLHFAGAAGAGFRYEARHLDRRARASLSGAQRRQGHGRAAIVLRVPAAVVDASAYPARLDPMIGPEFAIDDPRAGPGGRQPDLAGHRVRRHQLPRRLGGHDAARDARDLGRHGARPVRHPPERARLVLRGGLRQLERDRVPGGLVER